MKKQLKTENKVKSVFCKQNEDKTYYSNSIALHLICLDILVRLLIIIASLVDNLISYVKIIQRSAAIDSEINLIASLFSLTQTSSTPLFKPVISSHFCQTYDNHRNTHYLKLS